MSRTPLPQRRPNLTMDAIWDGHLITVTIGFDPATGAAREVFANTPRGGAMLATLADTSVLISIALQHGIAPADLAKSLGRIPVIRDGDETDGPASPVGTILECLMLAEDRP